MFDKMKQLAKLKEIQDKMSQEKFSVESQGTEVVINGKMQVESIRLSENLSQEEQAKVLRDCFNQAIVKMQTKMASHLMPFS
jgi:DNA-binding protein YbaB